MKATSKLISVVLILAMCLSMFTVSAFADTTQIITAPMEEASPNHASGAVFEGIYVSPGADVEEENDAAAVQPAAVAAPAAAEAVTVNDAASLAAAVKNGGKIVLGSDITMTESLELAAGTALNLKGKTLTFANGSALHGAALVANGNASVSNGLLVVKADEVPDANGNPTKSGFSTVASASGGVLTLNGVGVFFNAPQTMSIFGSGVALAYGSYNRDVSAYANFAAFDMTMNEDGRYVLKDKAAEPVTESVAEPASEPEVSAEAPAEEAPAEEAPAEVAPAEEAPAEEAPAEEAPAEEASVEEAPAEEASAEEEAAAEPADVVPAEEAPAEEAPAEEEAAAEPADVVPEEEAPAEEAPAEEASAEEEVPVDEQPVDETPVDIVEEEEKTYEEEVRVSEEEEASEEGLVTLTGTDPESGAVVIVTGKNLPEGLTVVVKMLSKDMLGGLEEGERALLALDITLVDAEGNEYEPKDDPNVGAVSVFIKHSSLENLDEEETLALYHIVDGDVVETVASAQQQEDSSLAFATGSFSPFVVTAKTGPGTVYSGSTGETHKKVISIKNTSGDIYVTGGTGDLTFEISGGAAPESISIIDPDNVSSGNASVYKAGLLLYDTDYKFDGYDPAKDTKIPDPLKVIIKKSAIESAPTGKWAVVFWFKDTTDSGSTRVYMVQYVTIVPKVEIRAISPLDEDGNIFFEKCDYEPVEIFLTADLKSFAIKDKNGNMVAVWESYKDKDKVKVNTTKYPNKQYYASEMFTVSDYIATDPVSHEFIAGKTLKLSRALLQKLDFGSDYTITVAQENKQAPLNAASKDFKMTMVPGIAVADGMNDYIKGKNVWIKFIACAPIDYDDDGTLAIWIGGQKISHDYYSISNDHQTLWIYRNLLDQLRSNNSYTLTARLWRSENGKKVTYFPATAQFNILAAGSTSYKSPKTGDNSNIGLWAAVLVLSGGAVVALIPKRKRASK